MNLNLTIVETKRILVDLIEVYRIMNCIEVIGSLFSLKHHDGTRVHTMKLEKNVLRMDIYKYSFHSE